MNESNFACIGEENAVDPKFGNKKIDKAVPFSCSSTETGQDTMKEQQGASTVENGSLKSAKTILSTVVNEFVDYQDHIFYNLEASKNILEHTFLKSEQPAYCQQKTLKRRVPAVNIYESVGN